MNLDQYISQVETLTKFIRETWNNADVDSPAQSEVDKKISELFLLLDSNQNLCREKKIKKILKRLPKSDLHLELTQIKSLIENRDSDEEFLSSDDLQGSEGFYSSEDIANEMSNEFEIDDVDPEVKFVDKKKKKQDLLLSLISDKHVNQNLIIAIFDRFSFEDCQLFLKILKQIPSPYFLNELRKCPFDKLQDLYPTIHDMLLYCADNIEANSKTSSLNTDIFFTENTSLSFVSIIKTIRSLQSQFPAISINTIIRITSILYNQATDDENVELRVSRIVQCFEKHDYAFDDTDIMQLDLMFEIQPLDENESAAFYSVIIDLAKQPDLFKNIWDLTKKHDPYDRCKIILKIDGIFKKHPSIVEELIPLLTFETSTPDKLNKAFYLIHKLEKSETLINKDKANIVANILRMPSVPDLNKELELHEAVYSKIKVNPNSLITPLKKLPPKDRNDLLDDICDLFPARKNNELNDNALVASCLNISKQTRSRLKETLISRKRLHFDFRTEAWEKTANLNALDRCSIIIKLYNHYHQNPRSSVDDMLDLASKANAKSIDRSLALLSQLESLTSNIKDMFTSSQKTSIILNMNAIEEIDFPLLDVCSNVFNSINVNPDSMINALSTLPKDERRDFLRFVCEFYPERKNEKLNDNGLVSLWKNIPTVQRNFVISSLDLLDEEFRSLIISNSRKHSLSRRSPIALKIYEYFIKKPKAISDLLNSRDPLKTNSQGPIVELIFEAFNCFETSKIEQVFSLVEKLNLFLKNQPQLLNKSEDYISTSEKIQIITKLVNVPGINLADKLEEAVLELLVRKSSTNKIKQDEFLKALQTFPVNQRIEIFFYTCELFPTENNTLVNYKSIVSFWKNIPAQERHEFKNIVSGLKVRCPDNNNFNDLISSLSYVKKENVQTFIDVVFNICGKNELNFSPFHLIYFLREIPPQKLLEIYTSCNDAILSSNLLTEIHKDRHCFSSLLMMMYFSSQHEKNDSTTLITLYLKFLSKFNFLENKSSEGILLRTVCYDTLISLNVLPVHNQIQIIANLIEELDKNDSPILQILQSSEHFISYLRALNCIDSDKLTSNWTDTLQNSTNQILVDQLSLFITANFQYLGWNDYEPLVQLAIFARSIIEQASNSLLNPYKLYVGFKEKQLEPVEWSKVTPVIEDFAKMKMQFNPKFLLEQIPQFNLTYAQLPSCSKSFIDDKVTCIREIIQKSKEADNYVNEMSDESFSSLIRNSYGDGVLTNLLKKEGNPKDIVPIIQSRLVAIVRYIESLNTVRNEGEVFSEQDEVFLRMLMAIKNCTAGKSEGINSYYINVLPAKFRYTQWLEKSVHQDDLHAKKMIVGWLAEEVEKMFSGSNPLMAEIIGLKDPNKIAQVSHQAVYLKNIIGRLVGLSNKPIFDLYTHVLYGELVIKSREELLHLFYKHFTPSTLVKRVAKELDSEGDEELIITKLSEYGIIKEFESKVINQD